MRYLRDVHVPLVEESLKPGPMGVETMRRYI